jgi:toxin ParE1/3/4
VSLDYFAPRAGRELANAAARIAEDNPDAAEIFLQSALRAAARVVARPDLGSVRPYAPRRYRFWPVSRYPYLLVYDTATAPAVILRVAHMAQDLPRLLASLPE